MSADSGLSSRQRKYLKGLAHQLDPVVRIGKGTVSEGVVAETQQALESHELIKVRIEAEEGTDRREMAIVLADRTGSALVGTIGKIAILFRQRADEPAIRLPS